MLGYLPQSHFTMKRILSVCTLLILSFLPPTLHAQSTPKQNALSVELLGKSFVWFSITNERYLYQDKIGLGTGLGFSRYSRNSSTQVTAGQSERGWRTNLFMSIPVYGFLSLGKGKHRAYIPMGVNFFCEMNRASYPSGNSLTVDVIPIPHVGFGYAYQKERWFFRVPVYLMYIGQEPGQQFPPVIPWAGIVWGWRY